MGAGSLFLSHVNDGGFRFVKESFNLSTISGLLAACGYAAADVESITHGNSISFLRLAWKRLA